LKIIKDPLYGYIEIESEFVSDVIDTANFQRLRNVRQTSYAPLYPSAEHSRFGHSLGVYYLGKMAVETLEEDFCRQYDETISNAALYEEVRKVFLLACLLHDIGHAPFSHTGEYFYDKSSGSELLGRLKSVLDERGFSIDVEGISLPANHDFMSAIIGLRIFGELIPCNLRDFFARCITGYKYRGRMDNGKACDNEAPWGNEPILNCFIELLHSSTIDVDRLDYLIRDAYISGYQGVSIDYIRLLRGLCLHNDESGNIRVAFNRFSLSILENVIYAHDAERKWIQSHPIVLYGQFMVKSVIAKVDSYYLRKTGGELFCEAHLLEARYDDELERNPLDISFLSDDDILFIAKNFLGGKDYYEYIARNQWRHPIWKSEAEWRFLLEKNPLKKNAILKALNDLSNQLSISHGAIDDSFIDYCDTQLKMLCDGDLRDSEEEYKKQVSINIRTIERRKKWAMLFKALCEKKGIPFSIIVLSNKIFQTGFSEDNFRDIQVRMDVTKPTVALEKISTILSESEQNRREHDKGRKRENEENLYYIFYDRRSKDNIKQFEIISGKEFFEFVENNDV